MAFIDPKDVISPRRDLKSHIVLSNGGVKQPSIAELNFGDRKAYGIRWNGSDEKPKGYPTAMGHPVWYELPELEWTIDILQKILKAKKPLTGLI